MIELATRDCQHPFEVVVLDVTMPDIDGVSVAVNLRACDGCRAGRLARSGGFERLLFRTSRAVPAPWEQLDLVNCGTVQF